MTIDTLQFIKKSAALVSSLFLSQSSFADTLVVFSGASNQDRDQDGIAFSISGPTQENDQAYAPLSSYQVTANFAFSVATRDLFVGDHMVSRVLSKADQKNFFDLSELTDRDINQVVVKLSIGSLK